MKKNGLVFLLAAASVAGFIASCTRSSNDVWEDSKSAGRHMGRGLRSLGGKHGDSRQIRSRSDFECINEDYETPDDRCSAGYEDTADEGNSYSATDYMPLQDAEDLALADMPSRQPRETPGEPGSSLPGIQAFRDPSTIPQMSGIFRNIYFGYDSSLIKGDENLETIRVIADYLRKNPGVYVFIEGHTDERGPQAYNLALGSRRSNAARNLLISEGVNPDRLFTISYGKERPVVLETHEEARAKNRRVEFKVYAR